MRHEHTRAEKRAWVLLRNRRMLGLKFKRQFPIDDYIVDFYCHDLRLIVEIDGGVHEDPEQITRDEIRDNRLRKLGYQILRVTNAIILEAPDLLEKYIRAYTPSPGPSGHPLPKGEGPAHKLSQH